MARLIRIAIPPDDIVAILMGGAPLSGTVKGVSWDPNNGGREVLTLAQPDGGDLVLKLDARDKRWDVMRAERHDPAGKLLWRVTNEDFKDHGDVRLPDTEDVQEPPHGADAEIKLRGVEPNIEIKDELFRLPPPRERAAGARRLLGAVRQPLEQHVVGEPAVEVVGLELLHERAPARPLRVIPKIEAHADAAVAALRMLPRHRRRHLDGAIVAAGRRDEQHRRGAEVEHLGGAHERALPRSGRA